MRKVKIKTKVIYRNNYKSNDNFRKAIIRFEDNGWEMLLEFSTSEDERYCIFSREEKDAKEKNST